MNPFRIIVTLQANNGSMGYQSGMLVNADGLKAALADAYQQICKEIERQNVMNFMDQEAPVGTE